MKAGPFGGGTHCLSCGEDFPSVDADIAHRPCPGVTPRANWAEGIAGWTDRPPPDPKNETDKPTRKSWFRLPGTTSKGRRK